MEAILSRYGIEKFKSNDERGGAMTPNEVVQIADEYLLPIVSEMYGLEGCDIKPIEGHPGGRNVVFSCAKEGAEALIVRIVYLPDRSREDLLGEVEYIRYLFEHGGNVSDVIRSRKGNLLEEITYRNDTFFICLFQKAKVWKTTSRIWDFSIKSIRAKNHLSMRNKIGIVVNENKLNRYSVTRRGD